MLRYVLLLLSFVMPASAQDQPTQILEIYREFLKPGTDAADKKIEQDAARICAELKCPHPYLAIESLTGPKEVWFFNGYASPEEPKQVAEAYGKNSRLIKELAEIVARRKKLVSADPVEVFATYQPGSTTENSRQPTLWTLGHGRFLVITITSTAGPHTEGSVFETPDHTRFIIRSAQTRKQAIAWAAAAGPETRPFAVRPDWCLPAKEWIVSDPQFWQP